MISDSDLATRVVLNGDTEALGQLYQRHAPAIHDFLLRTTRDPALAEDLTQMTFLKAFEKRAALRDPGQVKSWLFSIANHAALDEQRQRHPAEDIDERFDLTTTAPGPEDQVASKEAAALVWSAAASLEPRQYAVLDLTVRQQLTTPEVAEVLGIDPGHAVRYLLVARRRTHCPTLMAMVPAGIRELTPEQRTSVDHHMRWCDTCRVMAVALTRPVEILGGLASAALPHALQGAPGSPLPSTLHAQLTAAHVPLVVGPPGATPPHATGQPGTPLHPSLPPHHPGAPPVEQAPVRAGAGHLAGRSRGLAFHGLSGKAVALMAAAAVVAAGAIGTGAVLLHRSSATARPGLSSSAGQQATAVLAWSIVPSPSVSDLGDGLASVACVSASDCWAVGGDLSTDAIIEHWNGKSWALSFSSHHSGYDAEGLMGVTCVSASDCWAVGAGGKGGAAFIMNWDGSNWGESSSPSLATDSSGSMVAALDSVTCVSAADCWAVGFTEEENGAQTTLTERWDGTAWSVVPSPNPTVNPTAGGALMSVACPSSSECWAVGDEENADNPLTLRWNGTVWSIVPSPLSARESGVLDGVACPAPSECWAVGNVGGEVANGALIERWSGTAWSVVSSPGTVAGKGGFNGVACVSESDCWAVGGSPATDLHAESGGSYIGQALSERWDGKSWTAVSPPQDVRNTLNGVTCLSSSSCWAVGALGNVGWEDVFTLTEEWGPALSPAWAPVGMPQSAAAVASGNIVVALGVACVSASDCWAVGSSTPILHWNGSSWTDVSPPQAANGYGQLYGVACVSASDCWAVGSRRILHWNGSSWADVSTTEMADDDDTFYGVSCTSATNCWAVGDGGTGAFIERWNGRSWADVSLPEAAYLYGVACVSASDCWAVGAGNQTGSSPADPIVERWNGTSWATTSLPYPGALNAVTCVSASDCWAVGAADLGADGGTLIAHWDGQGWVPVSSPGLLAADELTGVSCVSASDCWAVGIAGTGVTNTVGYPFQFSNPEPLVEHWAAGG
jgi:RNA polymerase sigma factor (sigma-70 family)